MATKTWFQFLNMISNQDYIILSLVNTSSLTSNHRESLVLIIEDQSIILLHNNRIQQYYKIIQEQSKLKIKRQIDKPYDKAFLPCWCDTKNKFLIISPPHTITLSLDQIIYQSTEVWIKEYTKIDFPAIIEAINSNKIVFLVDGSFFPERFSLISAHIIITVQNYKLEIADFISLVVLLYRYVYTAELCRTLAIYFIMEYIIIKYSKSIMKDY